MTMFLTKVWGFDDPCGPLVFSSSGWRSNAAAQLKPGDRVILVGTKGDQTPETDRNRILGMMEPSHITVSTSDFPLPNPNDKRMFQEDGSYRWPFGLLNYKAWKFEPGLFLNKVAPREGNPFGSAAATGIVPLTPEEEARVLAHPRREIRLLTSINADQKLYGGKATKGRGAPIPTEGVRRGIMHMRSAPAYVYWFRLMAGGKIVGHKIGWAFDWEHRLRQFNSVSLAALGGLHYKVEGVQLLATARLAFGVEQRLLREMDHKRHSDNREVLSAVGTPVIRKVWDDHMVSAMLGKPQPSLPGKPQTIRVGEPRNH